MNLDTLIFSTELCNKNYFFIIYVATLAHFKKKAVTLAQNKILKHN